MILSFFGTPRLRRVLVSYISYFWVMGSSLRCQYLNTLIFKRNPACCQYEDETVQNKNSGYERKEEKNSC